MQSKNIRYYLIVALLGLIIAFARFSLDLKRHFLRGINRVDPATLHLEGEFVESDLGSAREPDGSVTVRMIAEQYVFVPRCVIIPAGVPVRLRITSADRTHRLTISDTEVRVSVVPGFVTEAHLQLPLAGDYKMPCNEFCGPGHYAMRAELMVVSQYQFPKLRPDERVNCATP